MTSATDVLRRMLNERVVEWEAFDDFEQTTQWSTHNGAFVYWARERDGKLFVETTAPTKGSASCTPEQAIAATLGAGTCCIEKRNMDWHCTGCGEIVGTDDPTSELFIDGNAVELWRYCPNCGRKVVDA